MDSFFVGSVQSWLNAAATAVGPLIALLVGFVGADRWLGRQLSENCQHAPPGGVEGVKFTRRLRPMPRSAGH
jgi:hypothetical protein